MQDAPQWATLVRLVAAGLGVSLAPACVSNIIIAGAEYRPVQSSGRTTIDLGIKAGSDKVLVKNFSAIARKHLEH